MYIKVKYEMEELERLISADQSAFVDRSKINPIDDINQEVERIKQTFVHEVFTFEDEQHLERYIQYHQQALIRLMDEAVVQHQERNDNQQQKNSYQNTYNLLQDLLTFIERHFAKYFDQDAKAPESYIATAKEDAFTKLDELQNGLKERNADPRIIDLMLYALRKIADEGTARTTYRKVMYAKSIQKELFRLFEKPEIPEIDSELRQLMYYLNYNSIKTFAYHTHYINSLLAEAETRADKIEKLSFVLKEINQAQVKPGIRFKQDAPSLKDQLTCYISEEIDYLERVHQLSNNPHVRSQDSFLDTFKLKLELSVAQLAYLIKVFIEVKIIQNKSLTELLRFLAKFVVTKRAESISFDSLRAKHYNVERSTKESVKSMLLVMVRYIEKD
jgi:hypothetical protein